MADRFEHLFAVLSGQRFLRMEGLEQRGAVLHLPVRPEKPSKWLRLKKQLGQSLAQAGRQVLEINLYDLSVEISRSEGCGTVTLEWSRTGQGRLPKELLQGDARPEQHLVPAIGRRSMAATFDILFLTGIGEVFPYIRSHNVLNNLQSVAKRKPMLMFFPGELYAVLESGASLVLFGRLKDDQYYRAKNILEQVKRDPMQLNEIFAKDVRRPIEGVIKADDEATWAPRSRSTSSPTKSPRVSRSVPGGLHQLHTTPTASGSPASSVPASRTCSRCSPCVLENRAGRWRAQRSNCFRPRATVDEFLPALTRQGGAIPSKSLLFNIDQKATSSARPDRRPAAGVRQGLRRDLRLLRQPGPHRPVRA